MRWTLVAVAACACGRIDFDVVSRTSDATPGCTFGPWSAPQAITELETSSDDWGCQITGDGLTLLWSIDRTLYVASRPDRQSPFGAAALVAGITGDAGNPSPTGDQLELYYDSNGGVGTYDAYVATRADTSSAWSNSTRLTALTVSGVDVAGPYITPDGLNLYYTRAIPEGTLMVTTRASRGDAFAAGAPVAGFTGTIYGNPALSGDQLTIYFEEGAQPDRDLYTASRPTLADPFGPPTPLSVNDPTADDSDVSITADGLELFFASNRAGGAGASDLYVATRACQ